MPIIYKSSDIITDIKIARLRWAGHVQRMKNDEMVKRIMEGKPEGRRGVGKLALDGGMLFRRM